ncbi:PAS domain S-box-containing protein/diguanylate cyclase (GGDEF) domain-containing protein [Allopseudospirillum japonicum]|uniref:PAS domain S-box-containing protein/diguanylate cyclase (GGDEF) domain-containing protein n=1 Tax=Allopseudospirillum japonicum TaxID=64971 RepID=A0A1H6Q894_9GAMM|nr:diguanylate cyclase [Allopseudospirillum japonicum]SEI38076.1 PAS domain S-box-containing protein/diguanylate cyclase (GGDEF) domain-containing protein [Allopseudospirillum japonicum]
MTDINPEIMLQVIEQSEDLLLLLSLPDGNIEYINAAACLTLGYTPQALKGQAFNTFLPELSAPELESILSGLASDTLSSTLVVTPVRDGLGTDRDTEFRLQCVMLNGERQPLVAVQGRDVSERVAITDEVHSLLADAQIETQLDPISRLFQLKYLLEVIQAQGGAPLPVLILDIKNLPQINTDYGHDIGDRILLHAGQILKRCAPLETDICSRYSGRRLVVLMPTSPIHRVKDVAERLSRGLARLTYEQYPELRIMAALGVSVVRQVAEFHQVAQELRALSTDAHYEIHLIKPKADHQTTSV